MLYCSLEFWLSTLYLTFITICDMKYDGLIMWATQLCLSWIIHMGSTPPTPSQLSRLWKLVYVRSLPPILPPQHVSKGTMHGSHQHDNAPLSVHSKLSNMLVVARRPAVQHTIGNPLHGQHGGREAKYREGYTYVQHQH